MRRIAATIVGIFLFCLAGVAQSTSVPRLNTGGTVFDVDAERLRVSLWLTVGTGIGFMALELLGSFVWLFELRAWLMFLKLALLCLVPLFWDQRIGLLLVILVIGSACSHMPGRFRYYSIMQHRIIEDLRKG